MSIFRKNRREKKMDLLYFERKFEIFFYVHMDKEKTLTDDKKNLRPPKH